MSTSEEAGTYCSEFIKFAKEFVEQFDQFLSGALRSQASETHNICKQDAVKGERQRDFDLDLKLIMTAAFSSLCYIGNKQSPGFSTIK